MTQNRTTMRKPEKSPRPHSACFFQALVAHNQLGDAPDQACIKVLPRFQATEVQENARNLQVLHTFPED